MPQRLNPICPFCISGEDQREVLDDPNGGMTKIVHCMFCDAWVPVNTWNDRPREKELELLSADYERDIDELDDIISSNEIFIKEQKVEIGELSNKVNSLEGDLFDLRNDRDYYQDQSKELQNQLRDVEKEADMLQREISRLERSHE